MPISTVLISILKFMWLYVCVTTVDFLISSPTSSLVALLCLRPWQQPKTYQVLQVTIASFSVWSLRDVATQPFS